MSGQRGECNCQCHRTGLLQATIEDIQYLLGSLAGLVNELELIVGKRRPHPRREEDK